MAHDVTETPTNLRTLLILEVLGKSDRPMTATEINAELGLPKQTVHRLCVTLEEHGFITRPDNSRKYQVGRRLREIGAGLLYNSRDHITRRQILTDVAQEVGETVNYAVPRETGMDYLDRVETDWAFRIQLPIGSRVPFHCTASGKTFLASLPDRKLKGFLEAIDLRNMTSNTHITKESLHAEIKDVRKNGYALDREEFMDDMVAIAVPVKIRKTDTLRHWHFTAQHNGSILTTQSPKRTCFRPRPNALAKACFPNQRSNSKLGS